MAINTELQHVTLAESKCTAIICLAVSARAVMLRPSQLKGYCSSLQANDTD